MRRPRTLALLAVPVAIRLAGIVLSVRRMGAASHSREGQPISDSSEARPRRMRMGRRIRALLLWGSCALILLLLVGGGVYAAYRVKSDRDARARAIALTGGDPDLGLRLTQRYGCAGCHVIPGASGAQGRVGPTLQAYAARIYVGGVVPNSPDNLIRWIENPRSIDPKSAMPVTGISRDEARHVATYLYTLQP
ncbi:cytochrome c family protein [Microvirga sp. 2MCAF35]|uniref:c-type cytochrome n=1 Tax=Microvirga sp. 2MCAF35 TaxID=3232987 RepID=UPI003F9E377B